MLLLAATALARDVSLPAFSSVRVCTAFNVVVAPARRPSLPSQYTISIQGDTPVLSKVSAAVKNGTLTLQSNGSFSTDKPIKVTVR